MNVAGLWAPLGRAYSALMTRLAIIALAAAALAACAPVQTVQQTRVVAPAFPEFIDAGAVIVVPEEPLPAPEPARAAPRRPLSGGGIPDIPEPSSELPPEGDAACGGVGIEANC